MGRSGTGHTGHPELWLQAILSCGAWVILLHSHRILARRVREESQVCWDNSVKKRPKQEPAPDNLGLPYEHTQNSGKGRNTNQ